MGRRGGRCARFVLTALLSARMAVAQPIARDVEAVLREGIAHRVAGRDEEAVARFEAAYAMHPAPVTAGQLALACQAVGRWLDADRYFREALAHPEDDWVRRHRRALDEAYGRVQRHVGELELRGGPAGATVWIDQEPRGTLPLAAPLRVRAGELALEVRAEGYLPFARVVSVAAGELSRERVVMSPRTPSAQPPPLPPLAPLVVPPSPPLPPVTAPSPTEHTAAPRRLSVVPWALGAGGLAAVLLGGVSLGLREASARRFNTACPPLDAVPRETQAGVCADELVTGDWTTLGAVVGFAAGAVLLGSAVVRVVVQRPQRAQVSCAPGWMGGTCTLRF